MDKDLMMTACEGIATHVGLRKQAVYDFVVKHELNVVKLGMYAFENYDCGKDVIGAIVGNETNNPFKDRVIAWCK